MEPGEDSVRLRLHAKDGEEIDADEIRKCLEYTVGQLPHEAEDA